MVDGFLRTVKSNAISGITASLTAFHTDPFMDEGLHQHTWFVTAFFLSEPFRDGRSVKAQLETVLKNLASADGELPDTLWSQENIAKCVLKLCPAAVIGVRVTRAEGFECWVWSEQ